MGILPQPALPLPRGSSPTNVAPTIVAPAVVAPTIVGPTTTPAHPGLLAPTPMESASEIRVLLVEDNPTDVLLVQETLRTCPLPIAFEHAGTLAGAVKHLTASPFDVILCDLGLPDASRLEAAERLRAAAPLSALVIMSGLDDEEVACDALRHGAHDYLVKGEFSGHSLLRAISFAITRKQMQQETERIRDEERQLKDEFLSNVSHEFRSPLASISSFASILIDEVAGQLNEDQHKYAGIILRNSQQLNAMVEDLLEVTRAMAGKLIVEQQCISLAPVVRETVESHMPAANRAQVNLSAEIDNDLPPVYADPVRMRQVLDNLVTNALKFTPAEGSIRIRLRSGNIAGKMTVEVADTGCGITPQAQEKIFTRLYQEPNHDHAGRKGLGLGLYICHEIVSRQGGKIWVESTPGKGSTFYLTVPVYSLCELISPLILGQANMPDSLAALTITIGSACLHRVPLEFSRDARRAIEDCLLPNHELLLPRANSSGVEDRFQILAITREDGAQVLALRLQGQLERIRCAECQGPNAEIDYKMLDAEQVRNCQSKQELAQWTAQQLGALIAGSECHEENSDC